MKWYFVELYKPGFQVVYLTKIVNGTTELYSEELDLEELKLFYSIMEDNKDAILNTRHPKLKEAAFLKMKHMNDIGINFAEKNNNNS
jgi:hypothetical protein